MTTVSLNYKRFGEGAPVLIVHGLFGSLDNWQTIARKISEIGYEVFILDMRNHGKSPHVNEMNHSLMAEDIKAFIQEHNLPPVYLIGHSMGGKTAMQLALTTPELIAKLIVVDIAPKPYVPHHNTYFEAMESLAVESLTSRRAADEALQEKVKNIAIRQFLLKNLDRTNSGFRWKFNLVALRNNYEKLIGGIQLESTYNKPTLFIGGKQSDYISVSDQAAIQEFFPNSDIQYVENSGHWVHAEQPEKFLEILTTFVENYD